MNENETSVVHEFDVVEVDYTYIDLGCVRWGNAGNAVIVVVLWIDESELWF